MRNGRRPSDSAVEGGVGSGVRSGNAPGSFAFDGVVGVEETWIVTCDVLLTSFGTVFGCDGVGAGVNSFALVGGGERGFARVGEGSVITVVGIDVGMIVGIRGDLGGDAGGDIFLPKPGSTSGFINSIFGPFTRFSCSSLKLTRVLILPP